MISETFMIPKHGDRLTEVSMISTKYGTDREIKVLGYIAEEPYVVLVELFTSYFVSGYNEELYPLFNTSLKHTLFIKDFGNRYELSNFSKQQFHDIDSFKYLTKDLELTKIISDPDDNRATEQTLKDAKEYMDTLAIIKDNNPIIQKAINQLELLEIYEIKEDDKDDSGSIEYLKNRIKRIYDNISDDYETMALLSHIMRMIIKINF